MDSADLFDTLKRLSWRHRLKHVDAEIERLSSEEPQLEPAPPQKEDTP